MRSVAENGTAASVFRNYPIPVGGKTGSAEVAERLIGTTAYLSVSRLMTIHEIAVCVIGENAGSGNRNGQCSERYF